MKKYTPIAIFHNTEDIKTLFPAGKPEGKDADAVVGYLRDGKGAPKALSADDTDEEAVWNEDDVREDIANGNFALSSDGQYGVRFTRGARELLGHAPDNCHGFFIDVYQAVTDKSGTDRAFRCASLEDINDSMELDSGQEIARLYDEDLCATLEVRGEVDVIYRGREYRTAGKFPETLTKLFHEGKADRKHGVEVIDNNWFEVFVWNVKKNDNDRETLEWTGIADVADAEGMTPEEIRGMLSDTLEEYRTEETAEQAAEVQALSELDNLIPFGGEVNTDANTCGESTRVIAQDPQGNSKTFRVERVFKVLSGLFLAGFFEDSDTLTVIPAGNVLKYMPDLLESVRAAMAAVPAKSFLEELSGLKADALKTINDYSGEKAVHLPTGEEAVDMDDSWLLVGQKDGTPKMRNKKAQRQIEKGLEPSWDDLDLSNSETEEICRLADSLTA